MATPSAFVNTVASFVPLPANTPPAPLAGAVNLTGTPGTGVLRLSRAMTFMGSGSVVPGVTTWGEPLKYIRSATVPGSYTRMPRYRISPSGPDRTIQRAFGLALVNCQTGRAAAARSSRVPGVDGRASNKQGLQAQSRVERSELGINMDLVA